MMLGTMQLDADEVTQFAPSVPPLPSSQAPCRGGDQNVLPKRPSGVVV
jgi:hypothetical protein